MALGQMYTDWLTAKSADTPPEAAEIRSLQLAAFAAHTPIIAAANIGISLVASIALWRNAQHGLIVSWAGVIWLIALWHLYSWWGKRNLPRPGRASRRGPLKATFWSFVVGSLWGASVIFYAESSETHRLLLMIMTAAMAAGASTSLGAIPTAAAAFICANLLPWVAYFLVQGDLDHLALASMSLIYMLGMLGSTRLIYGGFLDSVRAKRANASLLNQFHAERDEWLEISDTTEAFALFDELGSLRLWNENYRRILSLPEESLYRGSARAEILRACAPPVAVSEGRQTLDQWVEQHLRLHEEPDTSVIEQLSNGRWLKSTCRRTGGQHIVTLHVDITELKNREQALRESEARLKAFFDHSPVEMALKDSSGRYVFVSRRFEKLYGVVNEEIAGGTSEDLFPPEVAAELMAHDAAVRDCGRPLEREVTVPSKFGRRTFLAVKFPIFGSSDGQTGVGAVAIDITERKRAEQELERGRALLSDAVEALPDGFVVFDSDERLVLCNARYREILHEIADHCVPGARSEDLALGTAEHCMGLKTAEEIESWGRERLERFRNEGEPIEFQLADGRWIRASDQRLPNGWSVGIRTDITELKQRQKALEQSEKRFQDYAESSADWFWEMDADLRFTYFSPNVERIVHVSAEWHYGKTREEILGDDVDWDLWADHLRQLRAHEPFRDFVYLRAGEGIETRWLRTSGVPRFAEDGTFLGYRGSGSDVTNVVLAQKALEASEEQHRLVTDSLPVLIAYIDRDKVFRFVNRTCAEWFARPSSEIIGRTIEEIHPDLHKTVRAYIEAVLSGERVRFEASISYGDGRARDVKALYLPRFGQDGNVEGFFVLSENVSERKKAEVALRERGFRLRELQRQLEYYSRLTAMGQLSSALAHELNQPLTAVMNYVQTGRRLLQSNGGSESAKIDEMLDKAVAQSARAGDVIRRLRGLFEKGETDPAPESINQVVEDVASLALMDAKVLNIDYRFEFTPKLPIVIIDRIQVQQVVLNLVRNAVEALDGGVKRELSIVTGRAADGGVEVAVCDSGPGLSPELRDNLFDPFVTGKGRGMGVGLSISERIIKAHGGRLWVQPNPGGGTQFRFVLPVTEPSEGDHER